MWWSIVAEIILFFAMGGIPQAVLPKCPWAHRVVIGTSTAMLITYSALMASGSFENASGSLFVFSALGVVGWIQASRKRIYQSLEVPSLSLAAFCFLIGFFKIMLDPLWAHDARSIWFFHAKMLHFARGWGDASLWNIPDRSFFHFDYPKLIAVLSALFSVKAGIWNETLPKAALLAPFIMTVGGMLGLPWRGRAKLFLSLCLFGVSGSLLWIGYMDGYFAVLATLGLIYACEKQWEMAGALLAVAMNLKSEGSILALALAVALAAKRIHRDTNEGARELLPFLGAIPILLWNEKKIQLGLVSDIPLNQDAFIRAWGRLLDGSLWNPIGKGILMTAQVGKALLLLFGAALWAKWSGIKLSQNRVSFLLTVLSIHSIGIIFVYLITPHDLNWHISTSVARVFLPFTLALLATSGSFLTNIPSEKI